MQHLSPFSINYEKLQTTEKDIEEAGAAELLRIVGFCIYNLTGSLQSVATAVKFVGLSTQTSR